MPVAKWVGLPHGKPCPARKKEKLDKPGARARDARTRGNGYDTTIFAVFKVRIPLLGISVTSTEQVPFRIPFTFVPTNVQ